MAQAILLADVEGLGENGTAIEVSSGYLRNYLQPRGLAQPATPVYPAGPGYPMSPVSSWGSRPVR